MFLLKFNANLTMMFNAVAAQGGSDLDHSAMVLALETLANHKVSG